MRLFLFNSRYYPVREFIPIYNPSQANQIGVSKVNQSLPILTTERLLLKAVMIQDAAAYKKHFEVIQYLSTNVFWPYPEDGVEWFLNNLVLPRQGKDRWCYGIFLKPIQDELIGCVDLWREAVPENRGFWLGKKFWGHGYMTEAVVPVTNYAFNDLGFQKLYFTNAEGNLALRRVKEKSGATYIETRPVKFVSPEFTHTEL
jgi:RimJ/RimL family protein N-acetyltransferase